MKKKLKKCTALILASIALLMISIIPVSAADTRGARTCPNCGALTYESTTYGPWLTTSRVLCRHYPYGDDLNQKRTGTVTVRCRNCSYGYRKGTVEQTRVVCQGHN